MVIIKTINIKKELNEEAKMSVQLASFTFLIVVVFILFFYAKPLYRLYSLSHLILLDKSLEPQDGVHHLIINTHRSA